MSQSKIWCTHETSPGRCGVYQRDCGPTVRRTCEKFTLFVEKKETPPKPEPDLSDILNPLRPLPPPQPQPNPPQELQKESIPIIQRGRRRRSMEDVPPWIGNERLLDYYGKCPTDLHGNIFTTLFITGGRVSEVVELKPSNFKWNDEAIKVEGMLVKKYRKYKRRDFLIKRDEHEVLADDLVEFVSHCENEYLFPRTKPFTGEIIPDQHTSTARMYLLVQEITKDLWCHWFRGQRASFNVFVDVWMFFN